jgi:hypothetical protein
VLLCSPQIPHDLTRPATRAAAVTEYITAEQLARGVALEMCPTCPPSSSGDVSHLSPPVALEMCPTWLNIAWNWESPDIRTGSGTSNLPRPPLIRKDNSKSVRITSTPSCGALQSLLLHQCAIMNYEACIKEGYWGVGPRAQ